MYFYAITNRTWSCVVINNYGPEKNGPYHESPYLKQYSYNFIDDLKENITWLKVGNRTDKHVSTDPTEEYTSMYTFCIVSCKLEWNKLLYVIDWLSISRNSLRTDPNQQVLLWSGSIKRLMLFYDIAVK